VDVGTGVTDADVYAVAGTAAGQGTYIVRLDQAGDVLTVAAADGSNPRIDEIYLVVVDNDYDAAGKSLPRLAVRGGVAASSPSAPGPDSAWDAYVLLATIDLPAAAANIGACTITDERLMSQLVVDAPTLEGNHDFDLAVATHDHDAAYSDLGHVGTTDGHPDATASETGFMSAADKLKLDGIEAGADVNETDGELRTAIKTVDGAGSGLDADKLDGQHLSYFALSGHNHNSRYYTESEQNGLLVARAQLSERVRVYKNTSQAIVSGSLTELSMQSETIDDWGGHSGSSAWINDDGAGYYLIFGQIQFQASAGGDMRHIEISHSTDGIIAYGRTNEVGGSDSIVFQVHTVYYMNGSENVRLKAYQDSLANLNAEATSTWLEMVKL
jgi:hypothetical protein